MGGNSIMLENHVLRHTADMEAVHPYVERAASVGRCMKCRVRSVLFGCVALVVVLPGCGTRDDEGQVRDVAAKFGAALRVKDGAAACGTLSSSLRKQVGQSQPCARAILSVKVSPGPPGKVRVYLTSAEVDLPGGEADFLGRDRDGWHLDAIGCKPNANKPFDCEEEG
jgi:hypothetical protein